MLTRLQLQTRMNDREIQQYKADQTASIDKIARLTTRTTELQDRLVQAQQRRTNREEYSKFAEDLNRPRKFEIEQSRLEYDLNEGLREKVEEEEEQMEAEEEDGDDERSSEEPSEKESRQASDHEDNEDGMEVDQDQDATRTESSVSTRAPTPTTLLRPPPQPSAPTPQPQTASATVSKLSLLNQSRDESISQNATLVDEIADLEARKEMYERTWNQRKAHFKAILAGLHRFRSQVLEEKMEQERQDGMDEDAGPGGAGSGASGAQGSNSGSGNSSGVLAVPVAGATSGSGLRSRAASVHNEGE